MHKDFLLEDDEQDRIFDSEFMCTAPAVAAHLTCEIRQAASCEWPEEGSAENEGADIGKTEEQEDGCVFQVRYEMMVS